MADRRGCLLWLKALCLLLMVTTALTTRVPRPKLAKPDYAAGPYKSKRVAPAWVWGALGGRQEAAEERSPGPRPRHHWPAPAPPGPPARCRDGVFEAFQATVQQCPSFMKVTSLLQRGGGHGAGRGARGAALRAGDAPQPPAHPAGEHRGPGVPRHAHAPVTARRSLKRPRGTRTTPPPSR